VSRRNAAARLDLLAACAQSRSDEAVIRSLLAGTSESWDWPQLIQEARLHGVLPLTARSLITHCADLVPAEHLHTLQQHYHLQAARNALIWRELTEVLTRLDTAGIEAMPFKGPTLAIRAHGQLGLRQFSDLDVLIHQDDLPRVANEMAQAGFRHIRTGQVWQYVKFGPPTGGYVLDMQWGLAPTWFRFPLDLPGTWSRSVRTEVDGVQVLQPSNEDMLLLLCGHASKHCWSKLGWISDLNEFLHRHRTALDWDCLLARARETGGYRGLLIGFALISELMLCELPPNVAREISQDRKALTLATWALEKLSVGDESLASTNGAFRAQEQWRFHLQARERFRDRWPYVRNLVFERGRPRDLLRGAYYAAKRAAPGEHP
jgi:hypothetical protein